MAKEKRLAREEVASTETVWLGEAGGTSADAVGRRVRCPICLRQITVSPRSRRQEIHCPACHGDFGVVPAEREAQQPQQLGNFELQLPLGAGGFGVVWRAVDLELDRPVAIKLPRRGALNPREVEQFVAEARFVAQLRHPGIVPVYQVGRADDQVYIVSDLIDGQPLTQLIQDGGVSCEEAAELCVHVAEALEHAHQAGIVHRDLKPANILLDRDGRPHITDFGLALGPSQQVSVTVEGQIIGTPAYMSPEQARGQNHRVDQRSDIFSLGVILYELLTGERPFRGDMQVVLRHVMHHDPPRPRDLRRSIPSDLEIITLKCLHKDPQRRYASAHELAADLRRWLAGEPILARPASSWERCRRWCVQYPLMASWFAVVGFVLLLTMLGALSIAQLKRQDLADAIAELNSYQHSRRGELEPFERLVAQAILELERAEALPADGAAWQALLRRLCEQQWSTEAPGADQLASMHIHDPRGILLAVYPRDDDLTGRDFSQRDYFRGAWSAPGHAVHISSPYLSRRDGYYKIAVSQAWTPANANQSGGVLVASVITSASRAIAREERLIHLLALWAVVTWLPLLAVAAAACWSDIRSRRHRKKRRTSALVGKTPQHS